VNEQTLPRDTDLLSLHPNYPNPFNPTTNIPFSLAASAHVRLDVYSLTGQRVATLLDATRPRGSHTVVWDGRTVRGAVAPTGLYLCRLKVTKDGYSYEDSQRMLLLK